jgi:hypothetical protein
MLLFLIHLDFKNSAEEFYPRETLSTPMKLLSSLSSLIWCQINIINTHETLMKPRGWPNAITTTPNANSIYNCYPL